ncbi:body protein 2a [Seminavis robusta]|uniref:Body protein 2a n=1 Tax=Seminavis robusta TaxID=568900 RepID=A0A9N8ECS0_9STRA|nr:body protein 2a [Seminavis robusta]|eukprot:Sro900_g217890.1 body protein 2a (233) ;mRNA; f:38027-38923
MGNVMGKKKPLKEVLRENKRMINRAVRELDREKQGLEREEQRLTMEIKKAARANQMASVKIMAKDLVRTRQYIAKFIEMRSHLQGTALKLQTVKSHQAMAEAMSSTAQAMYKMNKVVNVSSITKMMAEFEKENAKTEMMQEIMGDAIDDAMQDDNAEEEEDRIVGQVLDEIGISMAEEVPDAAGLGSLATPTAATPEKVPAAAAAVGGDGGGGGGGDSALSDLEARLNNLKR